MRGLLAEGRRRGKCAGLALAALLALGCAQPSEREDLIALLPYAERQVEPLELVLGTPEARRHLVRGWSQDESDGALSWVWGTGTESVLDFHLVERRDVPLRFRAEPLRYPGAPAQTVEFLPNGLPGPRVTLGAVLADYEAVLPAASVRAGANRLTIRYAYAASPLAALGVPDARVLAVSWHRIALGGEARVAPPPPAAQGEDLVMPVGGSVGYLVRLRAGAVLRVDDVSLPPVPGASLTVRLAADGRPSEVVGRFTGPERGLRIALPAAWQGIARVGFEMRAAAGASGAARLRRPALEMPPSRPAARPRPARRPNVIVYLVDTLRADALGCYGNPYGTSPAADALARDGIVFERAVTDASWTRPAVASLFTGLPARQHGVNGRADALPDEALTMAEMFAAAGYETAAFVTNGNVAAGYGFTQGFETFELMPGSIVPTADGSLPVGPPAGWREPLSPDVHARATRWLDARDAGRPFLLYLHTADPHSPYAPSREFRERFQRGGGADLGSARSLKLLRDGAVAADPPVVDAVHSLYEAEVAHNDRSFGLLVDELRRRGLYDDALVLLLSDHGEEFLEHGGWEHGRTVHREVTRVPLVLKPPGNAARPGRVAAVVQLSDVLPTLVEYLGVAPPPAARGRSLLAAAGRAAPALVHLAVDGFAGDGVVDGRWALARTAAGDALYDHRADPGERDDVSLARPVTTAYLASLLERHAAAADAGRLRPAAGRLTPDVERNLRALGYVE